MAIIFIIIILYEPFKLDKSFNLYKLTYFSVYIINNLFCED